MEGCIPLPRLPLQGASTPDLATNPANSRDVPDGAALTACPSSSVHGCRARSCLQPTSYPQQSCVFGVMLPPPCPTISEEGQDRATLRHVAGQEHSLCQHKTYICPQLLGKRLSLCLMPIIKILQMINKSARNSPCCIFLLWRQLANCFI